VITLLIDGLIAVVKICDRALTAVEQGVRHRVAPRPVVDAQPAGAGDSPVSATGTSGHPHRSTSELLDTAAGYMRAYRLAVMHVTHGPFLQLVDELVDELKDRAAQFSAIGD
jgi:hypothetical protein